jgi:hypothetical protein
LVGTAHGNALDNLLLNPTLSDLVGGIQSVTLGDEEARRRGTQKTVLERKAPPTFDVLIELQTRDRLIVHEDIAAAVDNLLRDKPTPIEIRSRNEAGEINIETAMTEGRSLTERRGERALREAGTPSRNGEREHERNGSGGRESRRDSSSERIYSERESRSGGEWSPAGQPAATAGSGKQLRVYAFGVARNRLQQSARRMRVPLLIIDDAGQSDMIVTLKNYYRRRPKLIVDAERRGTPIYVLRANTVTQMENFLTDVFQKEVGEEFDDPFGTAVKEVKDAIQRVKTGTPFVDLAPQSSMIRRMQHEMAKDAHLESESFGDEPERRVRVLRRE